MTSQSSMSSLAKKRQSWLDFVAQTGPTAAQVHTQGDTVTPNCTEADAALVQERQTSLEPTEQAPINSGEKQITHNSSKHPRF